MTKPAITKRSVKGAALTFDEQDANFQNLKDATINITAGTGGTSVSIDLNGNLTLVAGSNVTLSGNNTSKTITITAAASTVTGLTNPLNADMDLGNYKIVDSALATIKSPGLKIESTSGADSIQIAPNGTGLYTIDCADEKDLTIRTYNSSQVSSIITLDHNNGITLGTGSKTIPVGISDGLLFIIPMTTTQRNTITGQSGMMIYNITTNKFQGYANGTWVDLH